MSADERVLVEVVERLTVEMQELVVRLEAHTGGAWARESLANLADMNVRLCAAYPELLAGAKEPT